MIRISYPTNKSDLSDFKEQYIQILDYDSAKVSKINLCLSKLSSTAVIGKFDFQTILVADFQTLLQINAFLTSALSASEKIYLSELFTYSTSQPNISRFFMEQKHVELSSCHYCNIDTIYSFNDMAEYTSGLDFVRRASFKELMLIYGIGESTARKILTNRKLKQYTHLSDLPVSLDIRDRIKKFEFVNTHNHFTLDHFYHKAEYPFLSLSLFNFVPCCYSCNSKFKGSKKLKKMYSSGFASPTSSHYSLGDDFTFRVHLHVNPDKITGIKDFSLRFNIDPKYSGHAEFMEILKIRGRYIHFKFEAFRLLQLKKKYPDSRIREIAAFVGKPIQELRNDIFGAELYDHAYDHKALVKFKRDIAKNLSIPGQIR